LPDPASPVGQTLARMRASDRNFDPAAFLAGAEKAFRMIVAAFAAGDRGTLRNLLAEDTYNAFEQAIAGREAAGQTQISTIQGIQGATVESAELKNTVALITVRFVSDQVSLSQDKDGHPVAGTDAVTEITDIWTFERDLSARDPAWRLVSARSA
jgi:predicted lipid-binding transport protein (Tim44 family)